MDEPTVGLDPEERVSFRNLLTDLSGERIVILSTHIVSDVEATATAIAIMNKGTLLNYTSPGNLLALVEGKVWECILSSEKLPYIREHFLVSSTARRSDGVHVRLVAENAPLNDAQRVAPTLEDAYLYSIATGRNAGEAQ